MAQEQRRRTGYTDKHGRDIYEGDIVKVGALTGAVTRKKTNDGWEFWQFGILPYDCLKEETKQNIEVVGRAKTPEDMVNVIE